MDSVLAIHFDSLLLVYTTYIIAAASPGPSNMVIMGTAMHSGRSNALALAAGVLTGSITWATLAATGISAILASYAEALLVIKIVGGLYLLWLAFKSARSALAASAPRAPREADGRSGRRALYLQGLMMHLTNPKAVLAWLAIMSLGVGSGVTPATLASIVAGCAMRGALIFGGYAVVFSSGPLVRLYQKARRSIEAALAMVFGFAGLRLLLMRA